MTLQPALHLDLIILLQLQITLAVRFSPLSLYATRKHPLHLKPCHVVAKCHSTFLRMHRMVYALLSAAATKPEWASDPISQDTTKAAQPQERLQELASPDFRSWDFSLKLIVPGIDPILE